MYEFVCVFKGHGHLVEYLLGYALVFFSREILGLNIWGSAHVCFFVIYYLFIHLFIFSRCTAW